MFDKLEAPDTSSLMVALKKPNFPQAGLLIDQLSAKLGGVKKFSVIDEAFQFAVDNGYFYIAEKIVTTFDPQHNKYDFRPGTQDWRLGMECHRGYLLALTSGLMSASAKGYTDIVAIILGALSAPVYKEDLRFPFYYNDKLISISHSEGIALKNDHYGCAALLFEFNCTMLGKKYSRHVMGSLVSNESQFYYLKRSLALGNDAFVDNNREPDESLQLAPPVQKAISRYNDKRTKFGKEVAGFRDAYNSLCFANHPFQCAPGTVIKLTNELLERGVASRYAGSVFIITNMIARDEFVQFAPDRGVVNYFERNLHLFASTQSVARFVLEVLPTVLQSIVCLYIGEQADISSPIQTQEAVEIAKGSVEPARAKVLEAITWASAPADSHSLTTSLSSIGDGHGASVGTLSLEFNGSSRRQKRKASNELGLDSDKRGRF